MTSIIPMELGTSTHSSLRVRWGQATEGSPVRNLAHRADPVVGEVKPGAESDADDEDDQPTRYPWYIPFDPEEQYQGEKADGQCSEAGVTQVGDQVGELADGVAAAFCQPEQLGELADRDEDGEAEDEALHHRPGQERCDETEAAYTRQHQEQTRYKDHAGGQGGVTVHTLR